MSDSRKIKIRTARK
ncbi:hypothetical protein A2U01_0115423, partial [Trifolium medium]|nr:hypothetical protein [Trifolium medium]